MHRASRILLSVHSALPGGAERMALAEAEHLACSYALVISIPEGPLRERFAAYGELREGTKSLPVWGDSMWCWAARCARTTIQTVRLTRFIRGAEIGLVITNSSVSLVPVLAARLADVPVVVHARDVPGSRLAPLVFRLHAMLADTVVVISDGLRPYFERGGRARVVRIPEGIALPRDGAPASDVSPRAGFHEPLRLCLIGGIHPRKGQDTAINALARLRAAGVDAALELVGRVVDPRFAVQLESLSSRLGVTGQVHLVGEVDDVTPHLLRTDIVIAPSRGEWTPLVLMEALAHERPVVAAGVGAVTDVITDHESGLVIPPDDPDRLMLAIAELRTDPAAAMRMARWGRRQVEARFSLEHTLAALGDEIERLLDERDLRRNAVDRSVAVPAP